MSTTYYPIAISLLNSVKAWRDSDGNEGFPLELRMNIDALLGAHEVRTAEVKAAEPDVILACSGLLGLLQLIDGRDDITPSLRDVIRTNHRVIFAQIALKKAAGIKLEPWEPQP